MTSTRGVEVPDRGCEGRKVSSRFGNAMEKLEPVRDIYLETGGRLEFLDFGLLTRKRCGSDGNDLCW